MSGQRSYKNAYSGIPEQTLTIEQYKALEGELKRPLTDTAVGYKGRYRDVGAAPEGTILQDLSTQAQKRRPS